MTTPRVVSQSVAVADPNYPDRVIKPNADGSVNVVTTGGSGSNPNANPATIYSDQQVVTASAVALTTQTFVNGFVLKAKSTNSGNVFVGSAGVTTTDDGSGNGYRLLPGESISYGVSTTAGVFIIGTANDVVYVTGN